MSALTEEVQQLKDEAKLKDEQNTLLVGEKGSLEIKICEMNTRVTKINGAIHQIFNEKEVLKATIEKQKSTIDILQNKSPIKNVITNSAASDTIKKLNDNLKI